MDRRTAEEMEFNLRGQKYRLSRGAVERRLKGIEPRPIGKYAVNIGGRVYPPKQVLERALELPLLGFTTVDAQRILSKLGFEVFRHPSAETLMPQTSFVDLCARLAHHLLDIDLGNRQLSDAEIKALHQVLKMIEKIMLEKVTPQK